MNALPWVGAGRARRGRRPAMAALVLALTVPVLAACDTSRVAPDAQVHISGKALDSAGHALAGTRVQLFKEADLGEALLGTMATIATLGAVCFVPQAPSICRSARVATTAADGSYDFTLSGSDTQGTIGQASTLDVTVADPAGGDHAATTTLRFEVQSAETTLPDARLWDAVPAVAARSGRYHLDWKALPAVDGADTGYSVRFDDGRKRSVLWSQPAGATGTDVDARLLEDFPSTAAAVASAKLSGPSGQVDAVYLTRRVDVAPAAGAPPSRGRGCLAVDATALTTTPQPVCAVTDGDTVTAAHLAGSRGAVVSGVVVDLGASRPLHLLVLRGLGGSVVVETSVDGAGYTARANGSGSTLALDLPGQNARFIRVRSPGGLDESLMTEVSVW